MSPQSSPQSCPSCRSSKYTSLPFGNVMGHAGRASTYRCLSCGMFFRLRLKTMPSTEEPFSALAAESAPHVGERALQRLLGMPGSA